MIRIGITLALAGSLLLSLAGCGSRGPRPLQMEEIQVGQSDMAAVRLVFGDPQTVRQWEEGGARYEAWTYAPVTPEVHTAVAFPLGKRAEYNLGARPGLDFVFDQDGILRSYKTLDSPSQGRAEPVP
jgi:hypothetical protein